MTIFERLAHIPSPQPQTPAQLLELHPHVRLSLGNSEWVLMEPSSSVLVFALAALALWIGWRLWQGRGGDRTRFWWAVSLLLWGAGAACAGVSYQLFAFEIKAAGREWVQWTSWWEVVYLLLSTASVNAMVAGVAWSSARATVRPWVLVYAGALTVVYVLACLSGAFLPQRFLVSFELMVLVTTPGYVLCFVLNLRRWRAQPTAQDARLMVTWLSLGAVMAVYFVYAALGATEALWASGWWFSANDVLHLGLIGWMLWIWRQVVPVLRADAAA